MRIYGVGYHSATYFEIFHDEVVKNDCIASSASSEADSAKVNRLTKWLWPRSICVVKGKNLLNVLSILDLKKNELKRYFVFQPFDTGPTAHDKRVVYGNDRNYIDAFGFKFLVLLEIRWQVIHMAGGLNKKHGSELKKCYPADLSDTHSEGTRNGE